MKRIFYLLLLIPFISIGQTATGYEQDFDYGLRNLAPQTVTSPSYLVTEGTDHTYGRVPSVGFNPGARSDTGVLTFAGLSVNSTTSINVGAVTGYVVDNETNPALPAYIYVNYAGATNVTVTTLGGGTATYVMLSSAGVISFQNTFPTSAERKAKIWLGKVSHPAGTVSFVINEPDYILSPLAFTRDIMQALGGFINKGVYPSANGANLNINVSAGSFVGDGINFVTSRTGPNEIAVSASTTQAFFYRTQTGGSTGSVTAISPGFYDNAGTVTAVGGGSGATTIQYMFAVPGIGYVIQYGQTVYSTFADAVAALGKESFVISPNNINNSIPIAAIVVNKSATALNNTAQAMFFKADKLGSFIGSSAGTTLAPTVLITITTSTSITTSTTDANSLSQNGRHVVINNGVNVINLTCNGGVTASYGKVGSGAVTFVQGSGRTLVQLSGTAVLNGAVGSTATLWSNGTTDYLAITNY